MTTGFKHVDDGVGDFDSEVGRLNIPADSERVLAGEFAANGGEVSSCGWFFDTRSGDLLWASGPEELFGFEVGVIGFCVATSDGVDHGERHVANLGEALVRDVVALCQVAVGPGAISKELVVTGPDGIEHRVLVKSETWCGGDIFVGTVTNLSTLDRVSLAMSTLIDRYRVLSEDTLSPIIVHQDGLVVYGNKAALDFTGANSLSDNFGRPITDFIIPDDIPATLERLAALKEVGDYFEHGLLTLRIPDGTLKQVDVTSLRTTWNGRPAFQVILHDAHESEGEVENYLANLVSHVSDAIIGVDERGRIASWNGGACGIYGWREDEVVGVEACPVLSADGWDRGETPECTCDGIGEIATGRVCHRRKDGTSVEVVVNVDVIYDDNGSEAGWAVVCTELSDPISAMEARRAAEARFESVVAALTEGVVMFDARGKVCGHNKAAATILGTRIGGWNDWRIFGNESELVTAEGGPLGRDALPHIRALTNGVNTDGQTVGLSRAGGVVWLSISARLLPGTSGNEDALVVCSFSDITDQIEAEQRLRWMAYHDPLTKLGNRVLFTNELESALTSARARERDLAVLFVDLDRFKMVNDSFGHPSGDEVLVELAHRFDALIGPEDIVCRFSGDEFLVLLRNPGSVREAREAGEAFLEQSETPIALSSGHTVVLSCSVGVTYVAKGGCNAEEALSQADAAMFSAKTKGKSQVCVFDGGLAVQAAVSVASYQDLHNAIANNEMQVHYQPIAGVEDGKIQGVEALARWIHPVHGVIGPNDFIPLAEDTDLIFSISHWILNEACATMAALRASDPGAREAFVSVNLSGRQFYSTTLVDEVATALERAGLGADGLVLEVTEEMLATNPAAAEETLSAVWRLGVSVAVTNYGTGFSSLTQLMHPGVAIIKIDRSFVCGDDHGRGLAAAAAMGQALGLTVVAEGVETEAELTAVTELGCDYYQGYLLGRPVPAEFLRFRSPLQALQHNGSR